VTGLGWPEPPAPSTAPPAPTTPLGWPVEGPGSPGEPLTPPAVEPAPASAADPTPA
jgi:hypothetical protein